MLVIGGGASGLMAAITAAEKGKSVTILEKNKALGEKLAITGGGRCNITNAEPDIRKFLASYGKASDFLHSAFAQFSQKDTFTFFESRGLPLVTQARNRVFPHTEKATDVRALLVREAKEAGIRLETGTTVTAIHHKDGRVTGVETRQQLFTATSYILATGGESHPETGSTGDGFRWLRELGHTVKAPSPTIVPLAVADAWVRSIPGATLSFMKITFFLEGKKQFAKTGKILFTHFGISGPLILNASTKVAALLESGRVTATIDAFPDTDLGALERRILGIFDANKNKMLRTLFKEIAPKGTADALETLLPDIDFATKAHSVTREERKVITRLLKAIPLTITNLMGFDRAVVADGGVLLKEIDTRSMRSKKIANLFVTGDLLHINRPSGGYSLQLCWTTGFVAGRAA